MVGLCSLDGLPQPQLEMIRSQCHPLEMALEELKIIVGQLLPGVAGPEVAAQRRNDERLNLGGGNAADQSGRLGLSLQHRLRDVIAVADAALVGMAWAHAVAEMSNRRPLRIAAEPRSRQRRATAWAASLSCTASNRVKSRMGSCSAAVNLAPVDDLADVESVLEQIGERPHPKAAPPPIRRPFESCRGLLRMPCRSRSSTSARIEPSSR